MSVLALGAGFHLAPHVIKPIATTATVPPAIIYSLFLQAHLQQFFAVSMYSLKPQCLLISSFATFSSGTMLIASLDCSVVVPVICSMLRLLQCYGVLLHLPISSNFLS